ncbi:MAG: hypothetical protein WCF83_11145, partial [Pseudolabrys sp.]
PPPNRESGLEYLPSDEGRSMSRAVTVGLVRVPTKPAMHSNLKPAGYSDRKPATLGVNRMGRFDDVVEG